MTLSSYRDEIGSSYWKCKLCDNTSPILTGHQLYFYQTCVGDSPRRTVSNFGDLRLDGVSLLLAVGTFYRPNFFPLFSGKGLFTLFATDLNDFYCIHSSLWFGIFKDRIHHHFSPETRVCLSYILHFKLFSL